MPGPTERRAPALVLAAGLGTRLRPLTDLCAKPLVPIGDRPAIAHVIDRLEESARVASVAVNAFHRAADVERWAASRAPARAIAVSREEELLGTAGGVARAASRGLLGGATDDVLVWNADILCAIDVGALLDAHVSASASSATLAIAPRAAGEGNVGVDAAGRVVRLRKETTGAGEVAGGAFLGVHVLGASLRPSLPEKGCLVGDVYLPALRRGAQLGVHLVTAPFFDVGTLADYVAANVAWLGASRAWVAPSASVGASVELDGVIVGEGACVEGEGKLTRAVVWPGCALRAPASDVIATPAGVVPAAQGRR